MKPMAREGSDIQRARHAAAKLADSLGDVSVAEFMIAGRDALVAINVERAKAGHFPVSAR